MISLNKNICTGNHNNVLVKSFYSKEISESIIRVEWYKRQFKFNNHDIIDISFDLN